MNNLRYTFWVWLAIVSCHPGFAAEKPEDAKQLEGVWIPVKAELAAMEMPDAVLKTITLKIIKNQYEVTVTGEPEPDIGTVALDPKAEPKGMTVKSLKGPNAGKTFPAIYELDANSLRICYDLSGAKRPTEFKTIAGTKLYLVTYTRRPHPDGASLGK